MATQGFPNGVHRWEDNLGKMAKNCMKMTKSAVLGQNMRGEMGREQANFSGSGWGGCPPVPATRGNPATSYSWSSSRVHFRASSFLNLYK